MNSHGALLSGSHCCGSTISLVLGYCTCQCSVHNYSNKSQICFYSRGIVRNNYMLFKTIYDTELQYHCANKQPILIIEKEESAE